MKKIILVGFIALSTLSTFHYVKAQVMTLNQLVELFISLGIIPGDKAAAARAALSSSSTTSCHIFGSNLGVGSNGSEVSQLTSVLVSQGFLSGATDSFDETVAAAMVKFQGSHGLPQTGYVGPLTRANLNSLGCNSSSSISVTPTIPTIPTKPTVNSATGVLQNRQSNKSTSISSVSPQPIQVGAWFSVYFTNGGDTGSVILKTLDGSKTWHIPYTTGTLYGGFVRYDGSKVSFYVPSTIGRGQLPENTGYEEPVPIISGGYNLFIQQTGKSLGDLFPINIIVPVSSSGDSNSQTAQVWSTNSFVGYIFAKDLSIGSQGADVGVLQDFLLAKGFLTNSSDLIRGNFSQSTADALSRYQQSKGMSATGFLGALTRAGLNADLGTPSVPSIPPTTTSQNPVMVTLTISGQKTLTIGQTNLSNNPSQSASIGYAAKNATYCTKSGGTSNWASATQAATNGSVSLNSAQITPGTYTYTVTCYNAAGTSASDSVTVTINPLPTVVCPQAITVGGVIYSLNSCEINMSMVHGQGNRGFTTTIISSIATSSYGFSTYGYGVGLPTYGILGGVSGGASGNTVLNLSFNDDVLPANGDQPQTYTGYLPINVYQGSYGSGDTGYLYLKFNLIVNPAVQ